LHRLPIIAGPGLTLLEEWKSVASSMGTQAEFVFTDFPRLDQQQVKELLKSFLFVQNEPLERASKWLVGRPRWVTEFIADAVASNKPIKLYIEEFVKRMTQVVDMDPQPRTILGGFKRVREKPGVSELAGKEEFNPYEALLRDAYLISMGSSPSPRKSPLLLEFGLGYCDPMSHQMISLHLEPMVLETARLLILKNGTFGHEFLRLVSEDPSAFGKRFEIVAATCLLDSFMSQNLELHPLLQNVELPGDFTGLWSVRDPMELCGRIASTISTAEAFYDVHLEPILYPDNNAGPDTVLTLFKPDGRVLKIFVQDKVVKSLKLESAKLTVDPAKFHHYNRGEATERVIKGVKQKHVAYLKQLTGPVIRVVVSALKDFKEPNVQWIPNGSGSNDLLLLIDSTNAVPVFGLELWNFIRECRSRE
jgi:hypothetical protein